MLNVTVDTDVGANIFGVVDGLGYSPLEIE
jgi:hypothetical protein